MSIPIPILILYFRIPVPREPFSFGGLYGTRSKYGDMDITGDGAMEFFSNRIKVTSKWPIVRGSISARKNKRRRENGVGVSVGVDDDAKITLKNGHHHAPTEASAEPKDAANFAGQM